MARRFFAGLAGGKAFLRQSKAGADARTGPSKDMLFDASYISVRSIGSSSFEFIGARVIGPQLYTKAHGLGREPDLLQAVSIQQARSDSRAVRWNGIANAGSIADGAPYRNYVLWNKNWMAPFFTRNTVSGVDGGGVVSFGWWYDFDATNIYIYHFTPDNHGYDSNTPLDPDNNVPIKHVVKWTALRFSA